jgi:hypothetical protein
MRWYPFKKLNILATFLDIDINSIQVWSDDSLTVGSNDSIEYRVTKARRKHDKLIGSGLGYKIYKSN